jgi:hypothetical protein
VKLFSDKVVYRFSQPLSELQINKANLYIRQYLTENGVTITANYSDKIDFKSGFFSGRQTLSRIDRGVIYIRPEGLELEFYSSGFAIVLVFIAFAFMMASRNFFLPILVATSVFFLHKVFSKSIVGEALAQLGRNLELL